MNTLVQYAGYTIVCGNAGRSMFPTRNMLFLFFWLTGMHSRTQWCNTNEKSLGPFRPVRPECLDFQAWPTPTRNPPWTLTSLILPILYLTLRVNRTNHERDSISRGSSLQPEGEYDNPSLEYERGNGEYEVPLATLSSAATAMDKDTTYENIRDNSQTKCDWM